MSCSKPCLDSFLPWKVVVRSLAAPNRTLSSARLGDNSVQICQPKAQRNQRSLTFLGWENWERHGETWREMGDERVCRLGDSARLALWVCRCPDPGWSMSVLVCPTGYAETFKVDGKARMPCCEGRRIRKDTERERGLAQIQRFWACRNSAGVKLRIILTLNESGSFWLRHVFFESRILDSPSNGATLGAPGTGLILTDTDNLWQSWVVHGVLVLSVCHVCVTSYFGRTITPV